MALRREYVATDPLYFEGEYRGAEVVFPADLPWEPPTCTHKRGSSTARLGRTWGRQ